MTEYTQVFPAAIPDNAFFQEGMTLRDYFAAKAMQGMLAYPGDEQRGSHHNNNDYDGVSSMAYAYAEAMLEARNK